MPAVFCGVSQGLVLVVAGRAGNLPRGQASTSTSNSHLYFPGIRSVSPPSSLWVLTANCPGGCFIPFSFSPNQIKLMKTLNWPCSKT